MGCLVNLPLEKNVAVCLAFQVGITDTVAFTIVIYS